MHQITGRARLAGVIGYPVRHSRSPRLHNHWLARYGIDGAYLPLAAAPTALPAALAGLRATGFAGVNVTIPHKEAAAHLVDQLDRSAERAGAVNTIVFTPAGAIGSNTDGDGFVANLKAHGVTPAGHALLLGAGGAARAIAAALLDSGLDVTISNRTPSRAQALAEALPGLRLVEWQHRDLALDGCDLLVNTTSLGMTDDTTPAIDLTGASRRLVVADIVYVPRETPLLAAAARLGHHPVDGLGMLLHQARGGFRAWFGVDPVVDAELEAVVAGDIPLR